MLYGVTGSGKSTAAARISAATGVPWTSVDDLAWQPGWVQLPEDEQRERITEICAGETWLLDTAYAVWRDVPLARVELVVGLDYPRWLSLPRLARRTVDRAVRRQVVCNGNTESWRMMVSRESILLWHFRSFSRKQRQIRAWAADPPAGVRVLRFTRPAALEAWVAGLPEPLETADSGDSSRSDR
jgi:adenylate kinase family enzyme